ncbi:hypothetical protein [Vibrio rotiferianus]|uniref:hypothetical protein n=1 Tax=Vibrio rotiferianus TaxID=190895 RepID=UPI00397EE563
MLLIKVMPLEFLQKMLYEGEFFFRPSGFFRGLESGDPRKDENDDKPLTIEISEDDKFKYDSVTFADGSGINFRGIDDDLLSAMTIKHHQGGFSNIYCFAGVTEQNCCSFLERNSLRKFGDYAIVIKDISALINLFKFAEKTNRNIEDGSLQHAPINYLADAEFCQLQPPISPFVKHDKYVSEFEYRFKISAGPAPILVSLGNISEFAEIIHVDEIEQVVMSRFPQVSFV